MKPNLINQELLDIDFKSYIFNKNSMFLNLIMILIILMCIILIFIVFYPKISKNEKKKQAREKLYSILDKTNKYTNQIINN